MPLSHHQHILHPLHAHTLALARHTPPPTHTHIPTPLLPTHTLQEFILKSRLQPVLTALAHGQSAANQVLVRKQAQNLLDAFQANVVL